MIGCNLRVAIEQALSVAKNIQAAEKDDDETNGKNDSQRAGCLLQLVNRGKILHLHFYVSRAPRALVVADRSKYDPIGMRLGNESI